MTTTPMQTLTLTNAAVEDLPTGKDGVFEFALAVALGRGAAILVGQQQDLGALAGSLASIARIVELTNETLNGPAQSAADLTTKIKSYLESGASLERALRAHRAAACRACGALWELATVRGVAAILCPQCNTESRLDAAVELGRAAVLPELPAPGQHALPSSSSVTGWF